MPDVIVLWEDEWDGAICKFTILLLTFEPSPRHSGLLPSLKPHFASPHLPYTFIDARATSPMCGYRKTVMRSLIKVNGCQDSWPFVSSLEAACGILCMNAYCVLWRTVLQEGGWRVNLRRELFICSSSCSSISNTRRRFISFWIPSHSLLMSFFSPLSPFFLVHSHSLFL